MKLRSITLANVRRFTDPVTIGPIGDGVSLLSAPNEAGKSTVLDALTALFFSSHGSTARTIKALQPHSGGRVMVGCEIDMDGALWRIEKQWLGQASAKVWKDGALVHQGDQAEAWLSTLTQSEAGGIGGLLWVRQGQTALASDSKGARAQDELDARRTLLTALSGAVDQVTGGARMDQALSETATELAALQTQTGKPKTGGRWSEAVNDLAQLTEQEAALSAQVDAMRTDIDDRTTAKARLADLEDPQHLEIQKQKLAEAQKNLTDAQSLSERVRDADRKAELARSAARHAQENWDQANARRTDAKDAEEAHHSDTQALAEAKAAFGNAARALDAATADRDAAKAGHDAAEATLRRIDRHLRAEDAKRQRARLTDRLKDAEAAETDRLAQHQIVAMGPSAEVTRKIRALARNAEIAAQAQDAAAPRLTATYEPDAPQVTLAGVPVPEGESRPLPADGQIAVPGIGTLSIQTGADGANAATETAAAALAAELDRGGWADLAAFEAMVRAREEAEANRTRATERRDIIAPDGIEALRTDLAALPADDAQVPQTALPDRAEAEAASTLAARRLEKVEAALTLARNTESKARSDLASAEASARASANRRDLARQAAANLPAEDEEADRALADLKAAADQAAQERDALRATVPDLEGLKAACARLDGIVKEERKEASGLRTRIGELTGRIETRSEEGVEDALSAVRDKLILARKTCDAVAFERDVLERLLGALQTAQRAARDRYFAPIGQELRPLLDDLWEDAELVWSDTTLLPEKLVRRGTNEPLDILSGGTQEQIAILVRLAFARLLAKAGRHAPLILDDALVYSDDARIEAMFNALHRAAGDLQILVLSCRQRAFDALGAPKLAFRPAPES